MTPNPRGQTRADLCRKYGLPILFVALALGWAMVSSPDAAGGPPWWCGFRSRAAHECPDGECDLCNGVAGTWYWLRSPDEEKRAVAALYNRYCIRCHGVDGRGVWDIPDVPNTKTPHVPTPRTGNPLFQTAHGSGGKCSCLGLGYILPR